MADKVAHVLIQPRVFEREMTAEQQGVVDDLIANFNRRMNGQPFVVAAQAIAILTADYCKRVSEKGGESICALQDIAGRGQEWLQAGDVAKRVVSNVQHKMRKKRKRAAASGK